MKDDNLSINNPLLWLRDTTDRGVQSLNFQGFGVSPWLQPRIDSTMLNSPTDMYQAMATAAVLDMRTLDPSKQLPASFLQFQQPQDFPNRTAALMQAQMLQQSQQQQMLQSNQENQHPSQLHLQQQQQHSFSNNNQQQQQLVDHQQISSASSMSQFVSTLQPNSPPMHAISSLCHQQNFSDSNVNPVTSPVVSPLHSILGSFSQDESSHLLNLPRTSSWIPVQTSTAWPSKRIAVDPLLSSGASQCVLPQLEQLGQPQSTMSQNAVTLPPFPGKECSVDQEGSTDPHNNLLFGVNIELASLVVQNGMSNLNGISSNSDSTAVPFQSSNYMNTTETDSSLNHGFTRSTVESGFLETPDNGVQGNSPNKTFVKVIFPSVMLSGNIHFFSLILF